MPVPSATIASNHGPVCLPVSPAMALIKPAARVVCPLQGIDFERLVVETVQALFVVAIHRLEQPLQLWHARFDGCEYGSSLSFIFYRNTRTSLFTACESNL